MHKKSILVMLAIAAVLAGCDDAKTPSAANFAKAINAQLAGQGGNLCAALGTSLPFRAMGNLVSQGLAKELDAMIAIGFVSAKEGSWSVRDYGQMWLGDNPPIKPGTEYSLTDRGQAFYKKGAFCTGKQRVKEILRWTEPNAARGATLTEVTYRTEETDIDEWATKPDLVSVFSSLAQLPKGDQRIVLVLMNDGWQTLR